VIPFFSFKALSNQGIGGLIGIKSSVAKLLLFI